MEPSTEAPDTGAPISFTSAIKASHSCSVNPEAAVRGDALSERTRGQRRRVPNLQQGGRSNRLRRRRRCRCCLIECPSRDPGRQRRREHLDSPMSLAETRGAAVGALAAPSSPWRDARSMTDKVQAGGHLPLGPFLNSNSCPCTDNSHTTGSVSRDSRVSRATAILPASLPTQMPRVFARRISSFHNHKF
jgi:hypothetical protein